MRILHCIPGMGGGGAERQLGYLAGEFAGLGLEAHVALLSGGPNLHRLQASGVRLHWLSARGNYDPRIFGQLMRTMRAVKPDLVQVWLVQMEILGGLAATALRLPWIFSERSSAMMYPPSAKHQLRVMMARRAAAIVSNSQAGDSYWRTRVNSHVLRYVVPNGLPLSEIDSERPASEEETGIGSEQRVVLFIGRFSREKNLDVLVSALRAVLAQPKTVAVLCGEGPLRLEVERRLTEYGISDRVRLTGYVPNVWRWMKRADVFVAPSLFEGQPNTVIEAMACGCPVVVSDIPAHRELLDETMALLASPHQADAFAEAILETLSARTAVATRARNARARVATLSIPSMARCYGQVYESVLARRDAGRRGAR